MEYKLNLTLITLLLIGLTSCHKEKVTEVPCDSLCFLWGTCIDGTCICDYGFEGDDCTTKSSPIAIRITKISASSVHSYATGIDYDVGSPADLFIRFYNKTDSILLYESPVMWDQMYLSPYSSGSRFVFAVNITIDSSNFEDEYGFEWIDKDLDETPEDEIIIRVNNTIEGAIEIHYPILSFSRVCHTIPCPSFISSLDVEYFF